jgi:RHS repeat-associated protein
VTGKTNFELLNASPANLQNRLPGFSYDAAGNMVANGTTSYTYDAENHMNTVSGVTYTYDSDGNRVKKSTGTLYWMGGGSSVLTETDLSGTSTADYIFFNGQRVARVDQPSGSKHFYIADHLGSASVVTNNVGAIQNESDYFPYGGEMAITNSDPNHYKFTGKERDSESGLDNFGARYDSSSLGRFMTPDWDAKPVTVPYASFGDPQTLNLYGYVENAPLNRIDADGHVGGFETARNNVPENCPPSCGGTNQFPHCCDAQGIIDYLFAEVAAPPQPFLSQACMLCKAPKKKKKFIPAKFVILEDKTNNKGSYSLFYYQLVNKKGQKLTGEGYSVEEHISPSAGNTTSEGTFVPAPAGVSEDVVGQVGIDRLGQMHSITPPTSPDADFIVEQTFTVKYQGTEYDLSTKFQHETQIMQGVVTNTVTTIDP